MTKTKKNWVTKTMTATVVVLVALVWSTSANSNNIYKDLYNNISTYSDIYKEVSVRYVDEIDQEKILKASIDGMLNVLDPYTAYFDKENKEELQITIDGKYEGVGIPLNYRNEEVTVAEPPFLGTPAHRAGIRAGDKIIKVDGVSTKELGYQGTVQKIRGPEGTEVILTILREGSKLPIEFTLVREKIKLDVVRYYGVLGDGIGYVHLTNFSKNSARDVAQAVYKLKEQNIKSLILDLRGNPGGILEEAVELSDLFLPKNKMIVSNRGRIQGSTQEYKSVHDPLYGDLPLAVLVNGYSASASEIVTGAIQDHDRGVVVGDTTFGKGLVQQVVPISSNSALKITTAKYYTPSGRSIQKQNYDSIHDSTDTPLLAYHTDGGRPVHGGGGIAPDVYVELPTVSDYVIDLRRKSLFFNFSVYYASAGVTLDSTNLVTPKVLNDFKDYLKTKDYQYKHPFEKRLEAFKDEAAEEGFSQDVMVEIDKMKSVLDASKETLFDQNQEDIQTLLMHELASKFYSTNFEVELSLKEDPVVQKAMEILNDTKEYNRILKTKK